MLGNSTSPLLPVRYNVDTVSRAGFVYCVSSGIVSVVFVRPVAAPPCDASTVMIAVADVWPLARLALVRAVAMSELLSFILVSRE